MVDYDEAALLVYPDETLILCAICGEPFCEEKLPGSQRVDIVKDIWGRMERRWGWSFQVLDCSRVNSRRLPICCVCADWGNKTRCPRATGPYADSHMASSSWHPACGNGWSRYN